MMKTLWKYRKDYYSLSGEDGIIEEILRRLKINKGWFVEFGAWDGKKCSNSFHLLEKGWEGIDIEGDLERFNDLKETAREFKKLHIQQRFVTSEGEDVLDNILRNYPIPKDFELLSIDVDSNDYQQWDAIKEYMPKIVIMEVNSRIMPGVESIENLKTSFTSMLKLGKEKGYTLVCHTGNMIFVRNDLIPKLNLPQKELDNPNSLFRMIYVYKKPIYYFLKFLRKQGHNLGLTFIISSLLLQYLVLFGIVGSTVLIGGNWITKEMIFSFVLLMIGWASIILALKNSSFKNIVKNFSVIISFVITILITYSFGQYLSQVGIPFLHRGILDILK